MDVAAELSDKTGKVRLDLRGDVAAETVVLIGH